MSIEPRLYSDRDSICERRGYAVTVRHIDVNMIRKLLPRVLIGAASGVATGYTVTLIRSLRSGEGRYIPVEPRLADWVGGELSAVVVQFLLFVLIGAGFGAISLIWLDERLPHIAQAAVYFSAAAAIMLPSAWCLCWIEHTPFALLRFGGSYIAICLLFWFAWYFVTRARIKHINRRL